MDGELAVYAAWEEKGGEQMIETKTELTKEEKIDSGLVRPYSKTSDRMIIEDLENGFPVEKIAKIYNRDVKDLKEHIEKIKGEFKPHRFKGLDDNFKCLYAAIFKQAARDDIATVKGMIYAELYGMGISKKEIHNFIDNNNAEIEQIVNRAVYKEAQQYPETIKSEATRNLSKIRNMFVQQYQKAVI